LNRSFKINNNNKKKKKKTRKQRKRLEYAVLLCMVDIAAKPDLPCSGMRETALRLRERERERDGVWV
jgi:hypothetical protein